MKRSLKKNRLHLRTGGRAIEVGDRIMYDTWCGLAVLDRRVGPDSEAHELEDGSPPSFTGCPVLQFTETGHQA
jgi:hypothetical protein